MSITSSTAPRAKPPNSSMELVEAGVVAPAIKEAPAAEFAGVAIWSEPSAPRMYVVVGAMTFAPICVHWLSRLEISEPHADEPPLLELLVDPEL